MIVVLVLPLVQDIIMDVNNGLVAGYNVRRVEFGVAASMNKMHSEGYVSSAPPMILLVIEACDVQQTDPILHGLSLVISVARGGNAPAGQLLVGVARPGVAAGHIVSTTVLILTPGWLRWRLVVLAKAILHGVVISNDDANWSVLIHSWGCARAGSSKGFALAGQCCPSVSGGIGSTKA